MPKSAPKALSSNLSNPHDNLRRKALFTFLFFRKRNGDTEKLHKHLTHQPVIEPSCAGGGARLRDWPDTSCSFLDKAGSMWTAEQGEGLDIRKSRSAGCWAHICNPTYLGD